MIIYDITLPELIHIIKNNYKNNNYYSFTCEISSIKLSKGHLYLKLIYDNSIIEGIIWRSNCKIDRTKLKQGTIIKILGNLEYYEPHSKVNFIINKIDEYHDNIGELYKKYNEIKEYYMSKGYFENKIKIPDIINNILLITSETGSVIHDFITNINNNKLNLKYEIKNAIVQGKECSKCISNILKNIQDTNKKYDLIIIMRGGGSFEDLMPFSDPLLLESVYNSKIPILSAIGHETDNPLLNYVATINKSTPSLASQFIIDHNKQYIYNLEKNVIFYKTFLLNEIKKNISKLTSFNNTMLFNIKNIVHQKKIMLLDNINNNKITLSYLNSKLYDEFNELIKYKNIICKTLRLQINETYNNLLNIKSNIKYHKSIELYYKGTKINEPNELSKYKNKKLDLIWEYNKYKIKIE